MWGRGETKPSTNKVRNQDISMVMVMNYYGHNVESNRLIKCLNKAAWGLNLLLSKTDWYELNFSPKNSILYIKVQIKFNISKYSDF